MLIRISLACGVVSTSKDGNNHYGHEKRLTESRNRESGNNDDDENEPPHAKIESKC